MKKEEYKDQGLRQALQRRNEAAERMTLSEDFTDRLMRRLEPTPTPSPREGRTKTLRWMAAAACLLIIIGVGLKLLPKEEPARNQTVVVKKTEQKGSEPKTIEKEPIQMAKEEKAVMAKTTMVNKRSKTSFSESKTSSLYIERMNKVIRADERLQRMVNSYILHTLDKEGRPQTAANMYNEKSEQDEE